MGIERGRGIHVISGKQIQSGVLFYINGLCLSHAYIVCHAYKLLLIEMILLMASAKETAILFTM